MINNKEIISKDKNYCKICGKSYYDGIMIIKSFICKKCVNDITAIECTDEHYEDIKDKVKDILFNR